MAPGPFPKRQAANSLIGLLLKPLPTNRRSASMSKNLDRWLHSWLFRRRASLPANRHIFIAVCDHFEPFHGGSKAMALDRTRRWQREFRKLVNEFRDSDGISPRHTFFYPIEQWDPEVCGGIAELCRASGAEMEIHLHHENDT